LTRRESSAGKSRSAKTTTSLSKSQAAWKRARKLRSMPGPASRARPREAKKNRRKRLLPPSPSRQRPRQRPSPSKPRPHNPAPHLLPARSRLFAPPRERIMFLERIRHTLRVGLKSIGVHRLRSTLTTMGIVLGVASVIVMLAVGEAARYHAIQQIRDLGAT